MTHDLTVHVPDRPGVGVTIFEAMHRERIALDGAAYFPQRGSTWGVLHLLVEDSDGAQKVLEELGLEVTDKREVLVTDIEVRPGALAEFARQWSDRGVNIDLLYFATDSKIVIGAEDMHGERLGVNMLKARFG